jgi:hypothetical protein
MPINIFKALQIPTPLPHISPPPPVLYGLRHAIPTFIKSLALSVSFLATKFCININVYKVKTTKQNVLIPTIVETCLDSYEQFTKSISTFAILNAIASLIPRCACEKLSRQCKGYDSPFSFARR